ncbi:MAG: thymidylate synthase [Candidatus Lokiarchaeota archaeon]|nr:thymidylate synthase [Candidatus Lokiarchaeota archaeon]
MYYKMDIYVLYQDEEQSTAFAEKFMGNIMNYTKFCISCGIDLCDDCRVEYGSKAGSIKGLYQFPSDLPDMIEEPEEFFPIDIPKVDILVVIGIHQDLLSEIAEFMKKYEILALIAPVENGDWVPLGLQKQIEKNLDEYGMEYAFPRPFCALDYTKFDKINEFIDYFKIGKPIIELKTIDDKIVKGRVIRASPCGCAWYMVRQLVFRAEEEGTLEEKISKAHHAYPCNASMKHDPVLKDQTLHIGGYIHRYCAYRALGKELTEEEKAKEDWQYVKNESVETASPKIA